MAESLALKFKKEKEDGSIKESWNGWLKSTVGITDSHGRKLHILRNQFKSYVNFRSLSITFSEMFSRRTDIAEMLRSSQEYASYWQKE